MARRHIIGREKLDENKISQKLTNSKKDIPFNGLFSMTAWVSRQQKGQTHLDFKEARDDEVAVTSISCTTCKSFARCSRQISMPTPHHVIFTGWMLFRLPSQHCQSTEGTNKHFLFNKW